MHQGRLTLEVEKETIYFLKLPPTSNPRRFKTQIVGYFKTYENEPDLTILKYNWSILSQTCYLVGVCTALQ